MKIRLTKLDGKLPNLALMKLAHFHKTQGDEVFYEESIKRGIFEPNYDRVYGSAIFTETAHKVFLFRQNFPQAIVGGTWCDDYDLTVESIIGCGEDEYENYDYSIYPTFQDSIGFTQRGCRLKCGFCVVSQKEGKNRSVNGIADIWRGDGHPKHLLLLDNDFFGQDEWQRKAGDIIDGNFKVCFSQGINVRLIEGKPQTEFHLIDLQAAQMLAQMKIRDSDFQAKRIYTAWDNARDEKVFLKGIDILLNAGIKPRYIMVYFLCNYWKKGLTDDVWHRFNKMVEIGLLPFPMIYDKPNADPKLKAFQRFVIQGAYRSKDTNFETFCKESKGEFYRRKRKEPMLF